MYQTWIVWTLCFFFFRLHVFGRNIIIRVFDANGQFVNASIQDIRLNVSRSTPFLSYDVFQIPRGFYFFYHYYVIMDENRYIIEPASGNIVEKYSPDIFSTKTPFLHYLHTHNHTVSSHILTLRVSCHYWHFHYETIAQLYTYALAGIFQKYQHNVKLILSHPDCLLDTQNKKNHSHHSNHFYHEILQYYGYDVLLQSYHWIYNDPKYGTFTNETLITATNPGISGTLPFPAIVRYLHNYVRNQITTKPPSSIQSTRTTIIPVNYPKRIFIDREAGYTRRIKNMPELINTVFSKYNISLFSPTKTFPRMSYAEQVTMYAQADMLIAPSGTGFSMNIAFCDPKNAIAIEIFPYYHHTQTGVFIAEKVLSFVHYHKLQFAAYNITEYTADFAVNSTMLDAVIANALRQRKKESFNV